MGLILIAFLCLQACDNEDPQARKQASGNIETYAGLGPHGFGYSGDGGHAAAAELGWITGIAIDADNNVFVSDGASNTVRQINASDQMIHTVAGTFVGFNVIDPTPHAGDGGMATEAHLNIPHGVAVDQTGNLIIADPGNSVIRKVQSSDRTITTIAGKPNAQGFDGDGGPATAAVIWNPYGVATDAAGNIFFSDSQNNAIRKVDQATNSITTIAGLGPDDAGYSGDNGPAISAALNHPQGIAVATNGDIYFCDSGNNVIRKISAGIISTIAGTGETGYTGDGGPATQATFSILKGIAVDVNGNIYIADSGNNVIRMISPADQKITTVAGNGTAGFSGDLGKATEAELSGPIGVAVDGGGNLYIADAGNSVVRKVIK